MTDVFDRTDIVAEARAWIGTPYRHQASLKGVGCDCLGLVRGVWRARDRRRAGARAALCARLGGGDAARGAGGRARRHLDRRSPWPQFEPGDVLLFRWRAGSAGQARRHRHCARR